MGALIISQPHIHTPKTMTTKAPLAKSFTLRTLRATRSPASLLGASALAVLVAFAAGACGGNSEAGKTTGGAGTSARGGGSNGNSGGSSGSSGTSGKSGVGGSLSTGGTVGSGGTSSPGGDGSLGGASDQGGSAATGATAGSGTIGVTQCNNGIDDDGDGLVDGFDPECVSPDDNDEGSFATGIPGDNKDPKWQDCFFDGNSGAGDDGCRYPTSCLTGDTAADDPSCQVAQACVDFCGQRAPNGCDCFGCCTVQASDGSSVDIFQASTCSLDKIGDADACPRCQKSIACDNPCGECELCPGKTEADLPDTCVPLPPTGEGGAGGTPDGTGGTGTGGTGTGGTTP
ncbi:MAG TPA: hypothetical protein VGQ57_05785, partial [Polyangiaceae bacterium]|nr:hypothetical protein [Polyangiaceae bacterium]